jgi:hypothetical protein
VKTPSELNYIIQEFILGDNKILSELKTPFEAMFGQRLLDAYTQNPETKEEHDRDTLLHQRYYQHFYNEELVQPWNPPKPRKRFGRVKQKPAFVRGRLMHAK